MNERLGVVMSAHRDTQTTADCKIALVAMVPAVNRPTLNQFGLAVSKCNRSIYYFIFHGNDSL